jgi:hypothetical protein
MGPRFNNPLYFEAGGTLEVCGPANFGPNDVLFAVHRVTFRQDGHPPVPHPFDPHILVGSSEAMWEGEFEHAHSKLSPGHVRATGEGSVTRRDGSHDPVTWANDIELIAPATFLDDDH